MARRREQMNQQQGVDDQEVVGRVFDIFPARIEWSEGPDGAVMTITCQIKGMTERHYSSFYKDGWISVLRTARRWKVVGRWNRVRRWNEWKWNETKKVAEPMYYP